MNAVSLANIFGPLFMRDGSNASADLASSTAIATVVSTLIDQYPVIFRVCHAKPSRYMESCILNNEYVHE